MLILVTWTKYKLARSEQMLNLYVRSTRNQAISIQKIWRGFISRRQRYWNKEYSEKERRAAMVVIMFWSKYKLAQMQEKLCNYRQTVTNPAITVQKVWRSFMYYRRYILAKRNQRAASIISRSWSKYRLLKLKKATAMIQIQKWSEQHGGMRFLFERIEDHKAARCIQASFRAFRVKCHLRHVTYQVIRIQKVWRSFLCRLDYDKFLRSVVVIQRTIRRKLANSVVSKRKYAVLCIQCAVRRHLAVCTLINIWTEMDYKHRLNIAATICQANVRRRIAMNYFHREIIKVHGGDTVQQVCRHHVIVSQSNEEGARQTSASYRKTKTQVLRVRKMDSRVVSNSGDSPRHSHHRKKLRHFL